MTYWWHLKENFAFSGTTRQSSERKRDKRNNYNYNSFIFRRRMLRFPAPYLHVARFRRNGFGPFTHCYFVYNMHVCSKFI